MEKKANKKKMSISKKVFILLIIFLLCLVFSYFFYELVSFPLVLLSLFVFVISVFFFIYSLVKKERRIKFLLLVVVLLILLFTFLIIIYPRLAYKKDFEKYCQKITENRYNCEGWGDDVGYDYNKRKKIENNIKSYCSFIGLDSNSDCPAPWSCPGDQMTCVLR